jgi:geranylgeranyl diphosphate synthase type I
MVIDRIRSELASIPEVAAWPEMVRLVERASDPRENPCWEYPILACQAVGGTAEQALPGAAAVFCLLYSIHLVDDLLDQDPTGLYHEVGEGTAANLALAFQAAAALVIERAELPPKRRAAMHAGLAEMSLATAYGQSLDAGSIRGEEGYWRVVEAKTPPLFKGALYLGALLGGAPAEVARGLERVGFQLGKSIQISDDLKDALEKPAKPDWHRKSNNLPILYAITADHPQRERFLELLSRIEETPALVEAQEILVRSGAVSFCAYHMVQLHKRARESLGGVPLADPRPIAGLLEHHVKPLKGLFKVIGVESPEELLA